MQQKKTDKKMPGAYLSEKYGAFPMEQIDKIRDHVMTVQ
jgi:hypothetical protein